MSGRSFELDNARRRSGDGGIISLNASIDMLASSRSIPCRQTNQSKSAGISASPTPAAVPCAKPGNRGL